MAKSVRALRCIQSFTVAGHRVIREGKTYRDDDPAVKGNEDKFVDVYLELGIVEKATKNPGQKRKAAKPAPKPEVASEPVVEPSAPEVADGVDSQAAPDAPSSDS